MPAGTRRRRTGVTLRLEACDVPPARLPEGEVKQALYNLVCNAVQASPPNAEVIVRVRAVEDELWVSVEDRGHGIPRDVLPSIFEPLFSTKEDDPRGGMGLGLSVSRSVAEAMGGRIEVSSEPGVGSVFTAMFPISAALAQE